MLLVESRMKFCKVQLPRVGGNIGSIAITYIGSTIANGIGGRTSSPEFLATGQPVLTTLLCKDIILHDSTKTPAQRSRNPSRWIQSPFIPDFSSCDKGKEKMPYKYHKKYSFDGCDISYDSPFDLISEYQTWIQKVLLTRRSSRLSADEHYQTRKSYLGLLKIDFMILCPKDKNWLYKLSERNNCWNDEISLYYSK